MSTQPYASAFSTSRQILGPRVGELDFGDLRFAGADGLYLRTVGIGEICIERLRDDRRIRHGVLAAWAAARVLLRHDVVHLGRIPLPVRLGQIERLLADAGRHLVAFPGALGIATVLILKDTVYNKNLLTTKVSMRIEESLWRPAHQGRPSALLHQWHDI